ncbi:MAG: ATP-grasp domain-containing protein [Cypionkella sp.]
MNERHGGALFVDRLLKGPAARDPSYLGWLASTLESEAVDFCLPLSEAELDLVQDHKLAAIGAVPVIMPGFKALEIGNDKLVTAQYLASLGLPGPWTIDAADMDAGARLPCIYKPRRGAGSKAIFVCRTEEEANFYSKHYSGGIFQELLLPADREVTCAVYRSKEGTVAVLQLLRTLVGGFTGWAKVIDNAAVTDQCRRLAEALDLRGSINVQLRITEEGPRIFEINSRFSSTSLLRHKMGFQDVVWTLREQLDLPIALTNPPVGTSGVRVQGAAIMQTIE